MKNQTIKHITLVLFLATMCTPTKPRWNAQEVLYTLGISKNKGYENDKKVLKRSITQLKHMLAHRPINPIESMKDFICRGLSHIPRLGIKPHHSNTSRFDPVVFQKMLICIQADTDVQNEHIQNRWSRKYWTKSEEEEYNALHKEYKMVLQHIKHPQSLRDTPLYRALCDKKPPFNTYDW